MSNPPKSLEQFHFLAGGGEMGARIRSFDWSGNALGSPATWREELKVAIGLCLGSSFPTAIYWGPELRVLYNDAWAPIPAHRHPWALGRPAREVWQDIWNVVGPQFQQVIATREGLATYDQLLIMDRGGVMEETYWNYSLSPIRDTEGAVIGIFNQGHETTAIVLAQRAHEDEIARLHEWFEQAPGAVALLDGPEHRYVLANAAYKQLVAREEVVGKTVAEVLPEVIEQGFGAVLDQVYRSGKAFRSGSTAVGLRRRPNAPVEKHIIDFVFQPMRRFGEVYGILIQATDVTARANAEAALRASESNLRRANERLEAAVQERTVALSQALSDLQREVSRSRATLETSLIYLGYIRSDGVLLEANAASLAGIEAHRDDVVDRYFWDTPWFTATPGAPELVRATFLEVAAGATVRRRIEVRLPSGMRTFDFSMRPVKDQAGEVIGVVPEAVDITMLLQTEERLRQSQKMEAIGQLTGGIAHDFNNLLTGIIGSLDLMERRIEQGRHDQAIEYAKGASSSAQRAAALTHRLLAFARRQPLDPKPVAANTLIASIEDMLRRTIGEKVRMRIVPSSDLWLTRCDPNQLENAILNLVINARDALSEGGLITVQTRNVDILTSSQSPLTPGEYVCISVQDNGSGMSPEVIAKAFDPFFTTKPVGQGTGLGLSMIYGFVLQSNGDITIRSQVGVGTLIALYLPRFHGQVTSPSPTAAETGSYRVIADRTVLVVEDQFIVRQLICDVLQEVGYRTIEAADGAEGLAKLVSSEAIDLLITDVGLPEMSGLEMVERARSKRAKLKILYITGYAEQAQSMEGLGDDVQLITKPFKMEALAQRVQEMMEKKVNRGQRTADGVEKKRD